MLNNLEIYFARTIIIYWINLSLNHANQIVLGMEFALKVLANVWTISIQRTALFNVKQINIEMMMEIATVF